MKKLKISVSLVSLLGVLSLAVAGVAPQVLTTEVKADPGAALLMRVAHQQLTIEEIVPVSKTLTAYVVAPSSTAASSQKMIVFVADDQYIIAGNVLNAEGKSLTSELTTEYITRATAKMAYREASSTTWFVEGSDAAPHKTYIVIDPNCIFCHMIYQEIEPMIAAKQLQVRWIPVGFLKPDSMGKAVALLTAKDPVQALRQDEASFNTQTEEGGLTPVADDAKNPAVAEAYVKAGLNTQFFSKNGFQGTPTLLYMGANGEPNFYPGYAKGPQLQALVNTMAHKF